MTDDEMIAIAAKYGVGPYSGLSLAKAIRRAALEEAAILLGRIPTTPEQMVAFIGSHFDSMQADGWTDTLPSKPTGDLSMVRYSLTVHDLLSAFDWSDLSKECIDAALANQKQAG